MRTTSIPNSLMDSFSLTPSELSFCVIVCRKKKALKVDTVSISNSELCESLKISKVTTIKLVKSLEEKGVLVVYRASNSQGGSLVNAYAFTKEVMS